MDWKGTHRTRDHTWFSVGALPAQDRDTAGHTFPPSGTRHMAGHCTKMEECHGLRLGLGIVSKASILTQVLLFSSLSLLKNDTWMIAYSLCIRLHFLCRYYLCCFCCIHSLSSAFLIRFRSYICFLSKNALLEEKPRFLSARIYRC